MKEEKKKNNLHVQNTSVVQQNTNKKKKKKKYMYTNSSYYYYQNQKKKKRKKLLEETATLEFVDILNESDKQNGSNEFVNKENESVKDEIQSVDNNEEKDNSISVDKISKEEAWKKKNSRKREVNSDNKDDKQNDDFIITKELVFEYEKPEDFKTKDKIEELQQAIDMYYYEEEMSKYSIKDEKKYLRELPTITEEEKRAEPEKKHEELKKVNPLDEIDMIIKFKSNPLPGDEDLEQLENKDSEVKEDNENDLIITREINFDYDAKDLKKKKVLNELKDAIESFDRIEMINEIESSVDRVNDFEEEMNKAEGDLINLKPEKKVKDKKKKKKEQKQEQVEIIRQEKKLKELDFSDIGEDDIEINPNKEIDNSDVQKDKQLDTQMQPLVEEDKFTQILNKIDLEEKLKEIADSEESSNYLAETFLSLKNKKQRVQYDTFNKKKLYWGLGFVLMLVIVVIILLDYYRNNNRELVSASYSSTNIMTVDREKLFNTCMKRNYQTDDKNQEMMQKEQEITEYVKNKYDASFVYQDVQTGYTFGYNSAQVYYAASTIKLLDALYVYSKAAIGDIDLDATITYTERYYRESSMELKNHQFGEEITIRDLVKYAVSVSDNSAHLMLISYIGKNKIKDFGNELGATMTMDKTEDNFGDITGLDAIVYLKALNEFINTHPNYAEELKNLFITSDDPYLNISNEIVAAHKYGQFDDNYHNIGIVYDKNPYMIAILTHEGYANNYEAMIRDINSKIYELHNLYYETRDALCYTEVYMD